MQGDDLFISIDLLSIKTELKKDTPFSLILNSADGEGFFFPVLCVSTSVVPTV